MKLFIIGNGFDRTFGLPTDYRKDLIPILKRKNLNEFEYINQLYFTGDEKLWSRFEDHIGKIQNMIISCQNANDKITNYFNEYSTPGDTTLSADDCDDSYGGADINAINAEQFVKRLQPIEFSLDYSNLNQFVYSGMDQMVKIANEKLGTSKRKRIKGLNSNDKFLTFNYTATLEKLYHINSNRIFHIHGGMGQKMIYGNSPAEVSANIDPNKIDVDFTNQALKNGKVGKDDTYYMRDYKESLSISDQTREEVLEKLANEMDAENRKFKKRLREKQLDEWLSKFSNINKIIVLGHSLGKVDVGYFEKINQLFPEAHWYVSYYGDNDAVIANAARLSFQTKLSMRPFADLVTEYEGNC